MCQRQDIPLRAYTFITKNNITGRYSHLQHCKSTILPPNFFFFFNVDTYTGFTLSHPIWELPPVVTPFAIVEGSIRLFWGRGVGKGANFSFYFLHQPNMASLLLSSA